MPKAKKRKEYISDHTYECIKECQVVSRKLFRTIRAMSTSFVKTVFQSWKKCRCSSCVVPDASVGIGDSHSNDPDSKRDSLGNHSKRHIREMLNNDRIHKVCLNIFL